MQLYTMQIDMQHATCDMRYIGIYILYKPGVTKSNPVILTLYGATAHIVAS